MGRSSVWSYLVVALVTWSLTPPAVSAIIHVDDRAGGLATGATWCRAFRELQPALDQAAPGDTIRIADGVYRPDPAGLLDPRDATFRLLDGVRIEGGYAGCHASDPDARDTVAFETEFSGDLNGDDGNGFVNNEDNCYHVVTTDNLNASAILDGVTIRGGNADGGFADHYGGGLHNENGSPTLIDCTFRDNRALFGGGIHSHGGSPTLIDCTFRDNRNLGLQGGGGGAGLHLGGGGSPSLTGCRFVENRTTGSGGAIRNFGDLALRDCVFLGNEAVGHGGGVSSQSGHIELVNCLFSGNTSGSNGAALYTIFGGDPVVTNCTFAYNSAGGAGAGLYVYGSTISTVTNCVFWGNNDFGGVDQSAQIHISYSSGFPAVVVNHTCIQGGWSNSGGSGIVTDDPLFIDPFGADGVSGSEDDNLRLSDGSPCVNAGDDSAVTAVLDLDGNRRIALGGVDAGAYESQSTLPGAVPNGGDVPGIPLTVATAGADLVLSWGNSCRATDEDYAVYEGTLADFSSHEPLVCTTAGATTITVTPSPGARYYLVVPLGFGKEGSYGTWGDGTERPQGLTSCAPQEFGACF